MSVQFREAYDMELLARSARACYCLSPEEAFSGRSSSWFRNLRSKRQDSLPSPLP